MNPFAIYFPQFYPSKTNDAVWGQGFTDWSLVAYANLKDQWARRAPARGFYDGGSSDVHRAQISEMKDAGLAGLAVYHYWFYSHQELDAFENTILDHDLDFPWFMIWATEGWSKRWIGDPTSIVTLTDSPIEAEVAQHCSYLARCFDQKSYFHVDGRPLLVIYNLSHFRNPAQMLESYRKALKALGKDVYFAHFIKNPFDVEYSSLVDATYIFEPRLFFGTQRAGRTSTAKRLFDVSKRVLGEEFGSKLLIFADQFQARGTTYSADLFLSYFNSDTRKNLLSQIKGPVQNVLTPGWNNTPRYADRFTALSDIDPATFAQLLHDSSMSCPTLPPLINAWNEWSEGAAIEPCAYLGTRYLDAILSRF